MGPRDDRGPFVGAGMPGWPSETQSAVLQCKDWSKTDAYEARFPSYHPVASATSDGSKSFVLLQWEAVHY